MSAIEEKYARAVRSSHLECPLDRPADIDVVLAAGMSAHWRKKNGDVVQEPIGVDLLRLRTDYDSVSGMPGGRKALALLKRMAPTRERLMHFAADIALARRFDFTPDELQEIVLRVLDLYLDPSCPTCTGTGLVGEYGTVRNMCPACDGSKARRLMWEGDRAEQFAQVLQVRMSEVTDTARRRMQGLLRG